jgi:hypothetical protein
MSARAPQGPWIERLTVIGLFMLLFPGFFFYHTLLGTGTTGAFLGGYFSPIAVLFVLPLMVLYLRQIRREPHRLARSELYFGLYMLHFLLVVLVNAANGANAAIVAGHLIGILFLLNTFTIFKMIDFANPEFRIPAMLCLLAMSAIVFAFSVDGVFYLGALGMAKDADSLATYQGFSRSYLITFLAVIAYTRSTLVRIGWYGIGAAALFLNTTRSEFVALLFAIPIIEFYFARQKMLFVLVLLALGTLLAINFDTLLAALPDNRILELLDLKHSSSANARHYLSLHAMRTIANYPLLGDYASYAPGNYAHNILSAWVDTGLLGFAMLLAILIAPAAQMFVADYFAARRSGDFVLGFIFGCVTLLLLITSHNFSDMLIGATLGAYSKYRYGQKRPRARAAAPDPGLASPSPTGPPAPRPAHAPAGRAPPDRAEGAHS